MLEPIEAQNQNDLPNVVEPFEAQNNIQLPIVVELIEAQNKLASCVIEPMTYERLSNKFKVHFMVYSNQSIAYCNFKYLKQNKFMHAVCKMMLINWYSQGIAA